MARPPAPDAAASILPIEAIVAVDSPREFRLHPRDRLVAYTAEAAGARQLFTPVPARRLPDPADGIGEADLRSAMVARRSPARLRPRRRDLGHGGRRVAPDPGRRRSRAAASRPRWSPDGRRLAFISRRRGWSQIWLIDAPVPRRGRPAADPKPPEPTVLTEAGIDVDEFEWSPDGTAHRGDGPARPGAAGGVADRDRRRRDRRDAGRRRRAQRRRRRALAAGWLAAVRVGRRRLVPGRPPDGRRPRSDRPDERRARARRAGRRRRLRAAAVARRAAVRPHRGPRRAPGPGRRRARRPGAAPSAAGAGRPRRRGRSRWPPPGGGSIPGTASGGRSAGSPTAPGSPRSARARPGRRTSGCCPVPGVAPDGVAAAPGDRFAAGRAPRGPGARPDAASSSGSRSPPATGCASRAPCGGRRRPPASAAAVASRRSSTSTAARPARRSAGSCRSSSGSWRKGSRSSTSTSGARPGYGRAFRHANHGEWGHADVHDLVDAARWAAEQPWSDGRLAIYGGSYGGYMVLCALVDEPSLWRAGIDLFGDSEIAESYRHGDRLGRLDLHKMMGSPDDPEPRRGCTGAARRSTGPSGSRRRC